MAGELMPAVQYAKYGGKYDALQHAEVPVPTPKKDEVLVKIGAASVNPADWKIQSGILRPFLPPKFPFIPGTDVAGEIVRVGPGVTEFSEGENVVSCLDIRVWMHYNIRWLDRCKEAPSCEYIGVLGMALDGRRLFEYISQAIEEVGKENVVQTGGSLAKYVAASVKYTTKRPTKVSAIEAACLPGAALTALQSVRDYAGVNLDGSYRGDILITAASGGVGTFAVQLAKLGGAHVTATCGSHNIELVKSLGADEVLDYKTQEGSDLKSPSGRKYDAIVHCTTGIPWSTFQEVLKPKGKVIDLTPSPTGLVRSVLTKLSFSKQILVPLLMSANSKDLRILVDLVEEGKLKTVIDSKFSLEEAKDAWKRSSEGHATGKIVVVVDDAVQ
ncbi:hypothetical protein O6H91_Y016100 [Diphasiastrum complanatum]|nr:hypothetical protein O6H91_Y016100 [Diphasiastrum complanatum]